MWTGRTCSGLSTSSQAVHPHPAYPIGKLFSQWLACLILDTLPFFMKLLSRQNYVCHDKIFSVLSQQAYFCCDQRLVCRDKNDVCGSSHQWYTLSHVKLQGTHPADPISKFFIQWLCQPGVVLVVVFSPIFKCKVTCYKW